MGEASVPVFTVLGLPIYAEIITQWGIILVLTVVALIIRGGLKERPGAFQNLIEFGYMSLLNFFSGVLDAAKAKKYFTFLSSLFVFIVFSNYCGILPGAGIIPGFKAPTSSLSVTLALGVVSFFGIQYYGIKSFKGSYFKRFVKPIAFIFPLLVLDEFIKPASLALRLYGNIFGEETVTERLYTLFPVGPPVLMMALSLLFCGIQAVVFTMLTAIYLDEATEPPEA